MYQIPLRTNTLLSIMLILEVAFAMSTLTTSSARRLSKNSSLSSTVYYSGRVRTDGPIFARPYGDSVSYYYEAIQITVDRSGSYNLTSTTGNLTQTVGYLYRSSFDSESPMTNLIAYDIQSRASNGKFLINSVLSTEITYILVVTAYMVKDFGTYGVTASGTGSTSFTSLTEFTSTYSGYLSSVNPIFTRPNVYEELYYYFDKIQVTISTSGSYSFHGDSTSAFYIYGCFYNGKFDASTPSVNQVFCSDDYTRSNTFSFTQNLTSDNTYTLVVTTFSPDTTGSYSVEVTGPSLASLKNITPQFVPLATGVGVGLISGYILFCIIFKLSVRACERKQQRIIRETVTQPQHNATPQNVDQSAAF